MAHDLGTPAFTYYSGMYATAADLDGLTALPGAAVDVGAYTVLASCDPSLDYTAASAVATFTISQKAVTVTTQNAGKTYGQSDPSPLTTADLSGFYGSDGITATFSRAAGEDVGSYVITTALVGSSVKLGDYNVTNDGATFTISPTMPTVTVTDAGGTYTSLAFAATGAVTGVSGANLGTPAFTYYSGTHTLAQLSGLTALPAAGGRGRLHGSCPLRRQPGLRGGQRGCHADDQPERRDGGYVGRQQGLWAE